MLHIKFTIRPFDKLDAECSVIPTFMDWRPLQGNAALLDWRLNGRLSHLIMQNWYQGRFGETILMPSEGRLKSRNVMVIGLGAHSEFNEYKVADFTNLLTEKLGKRAVNDFVVSFSDIIDDRFEWRNTVRLLVSKLHDYPQIQGVKLCESDAHIRDAKKRHMDFGMNVDVSFEMYGP